jgi:regulator of RNase E activity RraA
LPVTHYGSVDIFLEAIDVSRPGDVLVVDNQGRLDEGCIGDLSVIEAASAGVAGVIVWGRHRDTADLQRLNIPIFSLGSYPVGPRRLDIRRPNALERAVCGGHLVTRKHIVIADDDGVLFVAQDHFNAALREATSIRRRESDQANLIRAGKTLRQQFDWDGYVGARATNDALTFREHLKKFGGAIEV